MKEIPVFFFLGFLDAGKTKFIQETFEDARFDSGERTFLLVLEEGETEYDETRFAVKDYAVEYADAQSLTERELKALTAKHNAERVVVEYNGMRELGAFFDIMPEQWQIAQVMTFFDAATFLSYNKNMRQLVFDKIQYADMVVFNRFTEAQSQEEFHKIVRAVSRRTEIVYEYVGGKAVYDEIVDPLPFDLDAPVVEIADRDYAFFYRDLVEDANKYEGKIVCFKALVATDKKMKAGTIVVGRHIMTCCEADIAFSGLVLLHTVNLPFRTRDWVRLKAKISVEYHKIYGGKGPVLKALSLDFTDPPEEELATFY